MPGDVIVWIFDIVLVLAIVAVIANILRGAR
jgi:hypothetical protein